MILIDIIIGLVLIYLIGKSLNETIYGLFLICLGLLMSLISKFFGLLAWIARRIETPTR